MLKNGTPRSFPAPFPHPAGCVRSSCSRAQYTHTPLLVGPRRQKWWGDFSSLKLWVASGSILSPGIMGNLALIAGRNWNHVNCQPLMSKGRDKSQEDSVQPLLVTKFSPPQEVCQPEKRAAASRRHLKACTHLGFREQNLWATVKLEKCYDLLL